MRGSVASVYFPILLEVGEASLTGTSRGMFRRHIARPRRAEFASVQGGITEVARVQELRCPRGYVQILRP
jgi:hypothetical protein